MTDPVPVTNHEEDELADSILHDHEVMRRLDELLVRDKNGRVNYHTHEEVAQRLGLNAPR